MNSPTRSCKRSALTSDGSTDQWGVCEGIICGSALGGLIWAVLIWLFV